MMKILTALMMLLPLASFGQEINEELTGNLQKIKCTFNLYYTLLPEPGLVDLKKSSIRCYPASSKIKFEDYNIGSEKGPYFFTLSFSVSKGKGRLFKATITPTITTSTTSGSINATSTCTERGGVCLSDEDLIPKGYEATDACDRGSRCYLSTFEQCFGPFGNLPTAQFPFTDKYHSEQGGIVTKIIIYGGEYSANSNIITGIRLTYGSVQGPLHGGTGNKNTTCDLQGPGLYFGGVFGRARTQGTFDSLIYLLGFTGTTSGVTLCVDGTDNEFVKPFDIHALPTNTYRLAYVSGTESRGSEAMLGGLTFCFKISVN